MQPFGFLTNHGLTLLCIADDPAIRMRDIAATVDITERAAQRIVADLVEAGYVQRERVGRRNLYQVQASLALALPTQRDINLNTLLNVLLPQTASAECREAMPHTGNGRREPLQATDGHHEAAPQATDGHRKAAPQATDTRRKARPAAAAAA